MEGLFDSGLIIFVLTLFFLWGTRKGEKLSQKIFSGVFFIMISLGFFEVYLSYIEIYSFSFKFFTHSESIIGYFLAIILFFPWLTYDIKRNGI